MTWQQRGVCKEGCAYPGGKCTPFGFGGIRPRDQGVLKLIQARGLNHLTLRVSNLERSISFFCGLLGFSTRYRGATDAYLECGSLWLALLEQSVKDASVTSAGMDHFALTIADPDFDASVAELRSSGVEIVKGPLKRGMGRSVYFLGPDRIIVELHTSDLDERMTIWK